MSGRRQKINAVLLSALMILSMVAMSAVAVGGAAASEQAQPEQASFEVSDLDPQQASVEAGAELTVTATVTNTGDEAGSVTPEFLLDGQSVTTGDEITLDPDDSQTVSFTVTAPNTEDLYTHAISAGDGSQQGVLSVGLVGAAQQDLGDVDMDGELSAFDVIDAQRVIVGLDGPGQNEELADVTRSGDVSAPDVINIQRLIVGLIDERPTADYQIDAPANAEVGDTLQVSVTANETADNRLGVLEYAEFRIAPEGVDLTSEDAVTIDSRVVDIGPGGNATFQFQAPTSQLQSGTYTHGIVSSSGETFSQTIDLYSVEGAELSFDDQALGVDDNGNAVVYVDQLQEGSQTLDTSDPSEDFVVLYEGDQLTQDSLIDFRNLADAEDGELLLRANDASPGTHTVELYADSRYAIDPSTEDVVSVDADDHPVITDSRVDEDSTSTEESYVLLMDEDLSAPATADRQTVVEELQSQATLSQQPVVDQLDATPGVTVDNQFWVVNGMSVTVDSSQVSKADLEAIDGVEAVAENVKAQHPTPAGSSGSGVRTQDVGTQDNHVTFGLSQIDVPNFEDTYGTQGEGSRVAIIDDGLNPDHPDIDLTLGVNVEGGEVTVVNDSMDRDPGEAHGEHVAGTAVGTADPARDDVPRYSVAPGADLLKADIWEGSPTLVDTITAIQWSVEEDADVTSMSLGFGQGEGSNIVSASMSQAIDNANDAGTVVIGSAGNEGSGDEGGPVTSPGAEFNGLSIGASDENGEMASFSSGSEVTPNNVQMVDGQYPDFYPRSYVKPDVAAPGDGVLSTGPLGDNIYDGAPQYSYASGTSMAAPHAAGAVALIQSATDEEHSPTEIENALAESAEKPTTEFGGQNERDIRFGTGIINVTAATEHLEETTTVSGTVEDADGNAITGAKLETDSGVVTSSRSGSYETVVTSDVDQVELTVSGFGYETQTQTVSVGSGDQTADFTLQDQFDVTLVQDQPGFVEFGDQFNVTVDVRNLESLTIELGQADGVTADDLNVSVDGTPVTLGETLTFDEPLSADGVPVTVEVSENVAEGGEFSLDHTFSGDGETVEVTTGPTTTTEVQSPAAFELSNFQAPDGQALGQAEPYAASVNVTNTGQTAGGATIRWYHGPLGVAGNNPTVDLAPGETEQVSLDFGEFDFTELYNELEVEVLHGYDVDPDADDATGDNAFSTFTIGNGTVPLLAPINANKARGAAQTSEVYAGDVTIDDQSAQGATSEVTVSSELLPDSQDYVVVIHEDTDGLPVLGNSGDLNGTQTDITVTLDQEIQETTDVVAMLHFASDDSAFGSPITAYDPGTMAPAPVTDTGTVTIEGTGNVDFSGQALGTSGDGTPSVLAQNVETVEDGDYLVLTNGTEVNDASEVIDAVELDSANDGQDIVLDASDASPGQHTVVIHAPNQDGTGPDPNNPRTDATGDPISDTDTVFDGDVSITDQSYQSSTTTVTVDSSNLADPADRSYYVVIHNQSAVGDGEVGPVLGSSNELSGSQSDVTIDVDELTSTTDVLAMLHFPGDSGFGTPVPQLVEGQFQTVQDSGTVTIDQPGEANFQVSNLDAPGQVLTDEEITVNATITNTGDLEDTQDVEFLLDSAGDFDNPDVSAVVESNLTLAGGESQDVSITTNAPSSGGDYEHGIFTADDNQTATLTVSDLTAQRSIDNQNPAPGETVTVTLTFSDFQNSTDFLEDFGPDFDSNATVEFQSASLDGNALSESDFTVLDFASESVLVASNDGLGSGQFEFKYTVTPSDNDANTDFTVTSERFKVDGTDYPVDGDDTISVGSASAQASIVAPALG